MKGAGEGRWRRPRRFDRNLLVVGAGSAGLVASNIAAALGAEVTLVERGAMGGDCLNTGCVPSKALIRSARSLAEVARGPEFGVRGAPAGIDFAAAMARVQRVIARVAPHDSPERYRALGVEVIEGYARLVSPWEVEVALPDGTARRLSARAIVVAAGARPVVPPIPGLREAGCLTSESVWALRALPARLAVLGGGPIGCEFAQVFARFGAQVTQVEMLPRLLSREDPEVSRTLEERFAAEGVRVLTGHRVTACVTEGDERVLVAEHRGAQVRIPCDAVLVALGRAAELEGYGLEALGLAGGPTLATDAFLRTRHRSVYAAGDVTGPYQFTHAAGHQAWFAAVNALFDPFWKFKVDYSVMPWTTFTDPEVARVGLSEEEAHEQRIPVEVTHFALEELDRAIADGATGGFVKVLTVPGRDRILGATIVAAHAGELIAEFALAMKHRIGLNGILSTVHVYPTFAEANRYAAGAWRRAHVPRRALAWLKRFHAWRRR